MSHVILGDMVGVIAGVPIFMILVLDVQALW
jgi:hypothetical protein